MPVMTEGKLCGDINSRDIKFPYSETTTEKWQSAAQHLFKLESFLCSGQEKDLLSTILRLWSQLTKIAKKDASIKGKLASLRHSLGEMVRPNSFSDDEQTGGEQKMTGEQQVAGEQQYKIGDKIGEKMMGGENEKRDCCGSDGTAFSNSQALNCVLEHENKSLKQELVNLRMKVAQLEEENRDADEGLGRALTMLRSMKSNEQELRSFLKSQNFALNSLRENVKDLVVAREAIPRVKNVTPLSFVRDFVAHNLPCIITDLDFPRWRLDDLVVEQGGRTTRQVSVNVTRDGVGDAIIEGKFVKPYETKMSMAEFAEKLRDKMKKKNSAHRERVYYLSRQNDSLRKEFPELEPPQKVAQFANEAFCHGFGGYNNNSSTCELRTRRPSHSSLNSFNKSKENSDSHAEAVNLWVGDENSFSSLHKDFYENLYCVMQGRKTFWLLPPSDGPYLHETWVQSAHYDEDMNIIEDEGCPHVPWIPVDVRNPDLESYPNFARASPVKVILEEGETLYLPSLWYHAASQEEVTVAVNFWYDMVFDLKWCYFQHLRDLQGIDEKNPDLNQN